MDGRSWWIILEKTITFVLLWERIINGIRRIMDKVPFEIIPPLAFEQVSLLRKDDWHSIMARIPSGYIWKLWSEAAISKRQRGCHLRRTSGKQVGASADQVCPRA
jgi:hypothetical protein